MVDWNRVEDGVLAAGDVAPGDREAFLDTFCGPDSELRLEIESLLALEGEAVGFLEHSVEAHAAAVFVPETPERCRFQNYEIEREIGHGGMGTVYLAHRTDGEFDQRVALKIVRQSIADSHAVRHFRRERQILASLNHPNIATLLDGGVTDTGEPFLAMEYIDGETITNFVARTDPPVESILKLFVKVCSAVSYAHRSLVVHRDIKPGNILVTSGGEPKLLDFGLARLTDNVLDGEADQIETSFRALTPAYASPEQFLNKPITASTDIYSLGVLLYELLTGVRPFDFEKKTLDEIMVTISALAPLPPSAVAVPDNNDLETRSLNRRSLKGDLDTIILTALRKEADLRYASVADFADDVERHLKGMPVAARPHTARYRAGKFIRRHRIAVTAAALVLVSLVAGLGVSLFQARAARLEKAKAESVSDFLQLMLSATAPANALKQKNKDLTVKEVLDDASKRLASSEDLADQPAVKGMLQQIIGTSYLSIGQYDGAEQNLNAAYEVQTRLYGEESDEVLKTLVLLASLWTGRGDYARADDFYQKRLAILRNGYQSGRVSAGFLILAIYDNALRVRAQGDSKAAESLLREALTVERTTGSHEVLLNPVLALTLADQGRFGEAESLIRPRIEEITRVGSAETPELAANLTGLGSFQMEQGNYAEADLNLEKAESIYRRLYAPTYLPLSDNLRLQAENAYRRGDIPKAKTLIDSVLEVYRQNSSPKYISFATALTIDGMVRMRLGDPEEAERVLSEAVQLRAETLPPGHFMTAITKGALGSCLLERRKFAAAEPLLVESYEALRVSQGEENPRTQLAKTQLARLYSEWKNPTPAESRYSTHLLSR